jgi:hypothetical protein
MEAHSGALWDGSVSGDVEAKQPWRLTLDLRLILL